MRRVPAVVERVVAVTILDSASEYVAVNLCARTAIPAQWNAKRERWECQVHAGKDKCIEGFESRQLKELARTGSPDFD